MSHPEREQPANLSQHLLDSLGSIEAYNRRNSPQALMVRTIASILRPQEEEYPEVSIADREAMERDLIIGIEADDLMAMGIELVDIEGDKAEDRWPARFSPRIGEADKFKATLKTLNPTPEQSGLVAERIKWLLQPTVMAIEQATLRGDAADAEAQLADFEELIPDLVIKGFGNVWTDVLTEYIARSSSGTLADYIGAKARNLLIETGFEISQWQSSRYPINPEQLEAYWQAAFDYLITLRDRDEPSTFFTELFNKLRAGFDVAEGYIDFQAAHNAQDQWHAPRLEALKAKMIELSRIWETSFPLENAFYVSNQSSP